MTAPLSPDLRNLLAKVIRHARRVGEAGARQALQALAVDRAKPFESMSLLDKAFRNRLRMHGRQLRDRSDRKTGVQEIDRLAHEVAYEHWHRMLFARFLAENGLLTDPEEGVDLSLEDCRELAREQGTDPWAFAGQCAQRMLPEIFRQHDPVLELSLPPETRQELERLLESLPETVFTAPDSLGWTYQFWQAERKDDVNSSGKKIGADELPAVTQLFTERYMVLFLLHNTIGAWRAGKILADRPEVAAGAVDEEELRRLVRLETGGSYDFSYLRFVRGVRDGDEDDARTGPWRPAAGTFSDWPSDASELRVLDPCCGSGHFLVEALELLVRLRMAEEGFSVEETLFFVLRDNLFGLEIDTRCTQIAAFNLALMAWKLAGKPTDLPPLNIGCAGLAPIGSKDAWLRVAEHMEESSGLALERDLFGGDPSLLRGPLQEGMAALYELFKQGPELGSLLDPESLEGDLFRADFKPLRELLDGAIKGERQLVGRDEHTVAAAGMARVAEMLQRSYTLVATNVPFLARGKHASKLRVFAETHHGDAKNNLATTCLSRALKWLGDHGVCAVVSPWDWMFQPRYKNLRLRLLMRRTWHVVARLGPGAFDMIGGHVVNPALCILSSSRPGADGKIAGLDVSEQDGQRTTDASSKGESLRAGAEVRLLPQATQITNPDARILLHSVGKGPLLSQNATSRTGTRTSDNPCLRLKHWEVSDFSEVWRLAQSTVRKTIHWSGCDNVIRWDQGAGLLHYLNSVGIASIQGTDAWNDPGVLLSLMGTLPATIYTGAVFDMNAGVVSPIQEQDLPALWSFLSSPEYSEQVRIIDQQLKLTTATLVKVPFDVDVWKDVAAGKYPNGLPEPYSNDPTQWIFHGDPCASVLWDQEEKRTVSGPLRIDKTILQVAVARLLGYRWPAERDPDMRLAPQQREAAEYCRELERFGDADGIVCLSAVRGESNAADRLRSLVAAAYGDQWSTSTERALLAATGPRPPKSLEDWLRDRFFREHCQLFHNRPFIWHIWDGRKDGFHALVNYHRLTGSDGRGRQALESLAFAYLNDWVEHQRAEKAEGVPGADGRLEAALDLQQQLERILAGEPPCDLFVRWRPLHGQAIGWEPDINDGVRLNIRPFMRAELRKGGRAGAGILRWKPNIKWGKDRGKEPEEPRSREDFPWFWGCPGTGSKDARTDFRSPLDATFDGNRWNDLHYTRAAKEAARSRSSDTERQL